MLMNVLSESISGSYSIIRFSVFCVWGIRHLVRSTMLCISSFSLRFPRFVFTITRSSTPETGNRKTTRSQVSFGDGSKLPFII